MNDEQQTAPLGKLTDLSTGVALGRLDQRVTAVESLRGTLDHVSESLDGVRSTVQRLDNDVVQVKRVLERLEPRSDEHDATLKSHTQFITAQTKANAQVAEKFVQFHEEMVALKAVAESMAAVPTTVTELKNFIGEIRTKLPESSVLYAWVKEKKQAEDKVIEQNKKMIAHLRANSIQQRASSQNVQPVFLLFISLFLGTLVSRIGTAMPLAWVAVGYSATAGLLILAAWLYVFRTRRTQARLRRLEGRISGPTLSEADDELDD